VGWVVRITPQHPTEQGHGIAKLSRMDGQSEAIVS
jgi:hypothetical protein